MGEQLKDRCVGNCQVIILTTVSSKWKNSLEARRTGDSNHNFHNRVIQARERLKVGRTGDSNDNFHELVVRVRKQLEDKMCGQLCDNLCDRIVRVGKRLNSSTWKRRSSDNSYERVV